MGSVWNIIRVGIAAITIVAVAELSKRYPRYGALLLSLPIVSILAFLLSWSQHRDLAAVSRLSRETLVLVALGLPFFVPLAFAERADLSFSVAMLLGLCLAMVSVGTYLYFVGELP